jgi:membrane protein YqaA with SNARE-associated domain
MTFFDSTTTCWLLLGCLGGAFVSALVPWMNAEVMLLAALPLAVTHRASLPLVVVVTLGQMVGKSVMYWLSCRATGASGRTPTAMERWRERFEQHPRSAVAIVGLSALAGVPPFYLVSVLAGTLRLSFTAFLAVGSLGRLAHFGLLAAAPQLAQRWL